MRYFIISTLLTASVCLKAHPSYGIVITANGDIVFCDVLHNDGSLWKLDQNGSLTTLLTNQHCHYIFQDDQGNIWGTNHEYLPQTQGNRNTLWKYTIAGRKIDVISPTEDPSEFSGVDFVVDSMGNIYYDFERKIYVRKPEERPRLYCDQDLGRVMSIQMDECGDLYVVSNNTNGGCVYRIMLDGSAEVVAQDLREKEPKNPPFDRDMHNMLWASYIDADGSIYVANNGSRRITRISPDQQVEHIYHSEEPWFPVAYTERDGRKIVMEMGFSILRGGNIGPRIVDISNEKPEVLVEVK